MHGGQVALDDMAEPAEVPASPGRRRRLRRVVIAVFVVVAAVPVWNAAGLWWTWRNVEREPLDMVAFSELPPPPKVEALAQEEDLPAAAAESFFVEPPPTQEEADAYDAYDTYMVVGSDVGDHRADVIVLVLLPHDGSDPLMVSLPRDLYLPNRCTQGLTRINANYNGCGDINGATQLAGAVKDFTGIEVDHFVLFTMDGFEAVIDRLGGTEICVEHPVRDNPHVDFPAGCTIVDGAGALGWVRSRYTEEYVDGRWRTMPGVSDFTRNERQQKLILSMLDRAAEFESPREMIDLAESMAGAFTLDNDLGLAAAVNLGWTHRHVRPDDVTRMRIPVVDYVTSGGAQVLLPIVPFDELLEAQLAGTPIAGGTYD
ncbi:MAG: LCP family protein [Actinomycetota bacterium]